MTSAEQITNSLPRGRWYGSYGVACCPAHHDRKPSLSIRDADDGKVLVCCHAGCTQNAVVTALRQHGLWTKNGPSRTGAAVSAAATNQQDDDDAKCSKSALKVWQSTKPPYGTVVEKYLGSRGLDLPWLDTIRFHPCLKHPLGDVSPAMVAIGYARCGRRPFGYPSHLPRP